MTAKSKDSLRWYKASARTRRFAPSSDERQLWLTRDDGTRWIVGFVVWTGAVFHWGVHRLAEESVRIVAASGDAETLADAVKLCRDGVEKMLDRLPAETGSSSTARTVDGLRWRAPTPGQRRLGIEKSERHLVRGRELVGLVFLMGGEYTWEVFRPGGADIAQMGSAPTLEAAQRACRFAAGRPTT